MSPNQSESTIVVKAQFSHNKINCCNHESDRSFKTSSTGCCNRALCFMAFFTHLCVSTFICIDCILLDSAFCFREYFPPQLVFSFSSLIQFTTLFGQYTAVSEPHKQQLAGLCNSKAELHSATQCTFMHNSLFLWPTRFHLFIKPLNSLSTPYCSYTHTFTLLDRANTHTHTHRRMGGYDMPSCSKTMPNYHKHTVTGTHTHTHIQINCYIQTRTHTHTHTQPSVAPCRKRFCFVAC